ncbi:MAG: hypothetical protein U1E65_20685 [Myxococcota bacterium]
MEKADPIRKDPVTAAEVEAKARGKADKITQCYRSERMNVGINAPAGADALTRFVFRIHVPTTGEKVGVTILKSSRADQVLLGECITKALQQLTFPPYVGNPLDLELPIEP